MAPQFVVQGLFNLSGTCFRRPLPTRASDLERYSWFLLPPPICMPILPLPPHIVLTNMLCTAQVHIQQHRLSKFVRERTMQPTPVITLNSNSSGRHNINEPLLNLQPFQHIIYQLHSPLDRRSQDPCTTFKGERLPSAHCMLSTTPRPISAFLTLHAL